MRSFIADARLAVRTLVRARGFTTACVLTLAIGIGATTAVFSLVDAILIRPLPYPESDRIVAIGHAAEGVDLVAGGVSDGAYLQYRTNSTSFEALATWYENVVNLTGPGEAERVPVALVSESFFAVFGARTVVGRLPRSDDVDGSGEVVVLISHALWQRRFGGDAAIVGSTIDINHGARRVIGVLEPDFGFPRREIDIWYPTEPDAATARASDLYQSGIGRLRPGVDPAQAEVELNRLVTTLPDAYPDLTRQVISDARLRAVVTPLKDEVVGSARAPLWLLLGGMFFLLAIACANVANLFLVRGEYRQREVAVRAALGAGRADLARLFVAESTIIALLGGALGLYVADGAVHLLAARAPVTLPRLHEVGVDLRVGAFALGVSLLTAILFAVPSLLRARRVAPFAALREGSFGMSAPPARRRARRILVVAQVALALLLLVGSALMAQSFLQLRRADPGFDAAGVWTAEIALPFRGYERYEDAQRFWSELLERVRALPGVERAGAATSVPLVPRPAYHDLALDIEDRPAETRAAITVHHVTPGYFEALRIPLREGQGIEAGTRSAERAVLLSAAAARRLFPGERAIGKRIRRSVGSGTAWATVVGVTGDVPRDQIGGAPAEVVYVPALDAAVDERLIPRHGTLVLRATGAPLTLSASVRGIVRDLDAGLPMANVRTRERIVADSMARTRFLMLLLGTAAAAALFLGAVGLYGVISYDVSRRVNEFGIRIALGAGVGTVRRLVLRESLRLALIGVAAGTVAALALTRFLRGLVYGIRPNDPLTFIAMAALLLAVAAIATLIPARRMARIDPIAALRTN